MYYPILFQPKIPSDQTNSFLTNVAVCRLTSCMYPAGEIQLDLSRNAFSGLRTCLHNSCQQWVLYIYERGQVWTQSRKWNWTQYRTGVMFNELAHDGPRDGKRSWKELSISLPAVTELINNMTPRSILCPISLSISSPTVPLFIKNMTPGQYCARFRFRFRDPPRPSSLGIWPQKYDSRYMTPDIWLQKYDSRNMTPDQYSDRSRFRLCDRRDRMMHCNSLGGNATSWTGSYSQWIVTSCQPHMVTSTG